MSHAGGVETLRRSVSPGTLKRKRESGQASPDIGAKAARFTNSATFTAPRLHSTTNGSNPAGRSPYPDEALHSDSGDTLRGLGSASSHTSTSSTVFSTSQTRKASAANGLTPLTSNSDSSSPKHQSSPHKHFSNMAAPNGSSAAASSPPHDLARNRPHLLPPRGTAKGYRVVWDPELDGKLSREERKRAIIRRRDFGTEVRYTFHNLLSLRNILIYP